jgi:hypothetical protein
MAGRVKFTAAALLLLLGACTSQQELRKAELASLMAQLPGGYDNLQQVQADGAAGRAGAHAAQALLIFRLQSPLVGDDVLYVRETAADDARRVTAERIWSLKVDTGGRIIATQARFEEPERWRIGLESPELFRSLLLRDLHVIEGCELLWQKSASGFSGDSLGGGCRRGGAAGATLQLQHWRLGSDTLDLNEDASGAGVAAPAATDYYRFVRRSGAG